VARWPSCRQPAGITRWICKIRHGICLQQVGPKPLIQAAVTGKCAKCCFDHCSPRLRAAPFIAASALSVD